MIVNFLCPFSIALNLNRNLVLSQWIFPFANDCINYLIGYSMDLTFSPGGTRARAKNASTN